eukprot:scaffold16699_cov97-Isochrysis_galbana.AAC.2
MVTCSSPPGIPAAKVGCRRRPRGISAALACIRPSSRRARASSWAAEASASLSKRTTAAISSASSRAAALSATCALRLATSDARASASACRADSRHSRSSPSAASRATFSAARAAPAPAIWRSSPAISDWRCTISARDRCSSSSSARGSAISARDCCSSRISARRCATSDRQPTEAARRQAASAIAVRCRSHPSTACTSTAPRAILSSCTAAAACDAAPAGSPRRERRSSWSSSAAPSRAPGLERNARTLELGDEPPTAARGGVCSSPVRPSHLALSRSAAGHALPTLSYRLGGLAGLLRRPSSRSACTARRISSSACSTLELEPAICALTTSSRARHVAESLRVSRRSASSWSRRTRWRISSRQSCGIGCRC